MSNLCSSGHVVAQVQGHMGFITLSRARALNALSLPMVRDLARVLAAWRSDPAVLGIALRGMGKAPPKASGEGQGSLASEQAFGAFCAGGDIRFFHQAALTGDDVALADFFTEEYQLNHAIHTYPKPIIAFMDGICMGGGMGIAQGASLRVVSERSAMAMPETAIGLFPDVGGGYFLSRCPGAIGEYLAMTGQSIGAVDAIAVGLADGTIPSGQLASLWDTLGATPFESANAIEHYVASKFIANYAQPALLRSQIDAIFTLPNVPAMLQALQQMGNAWSAQTTAQLQRSSPLMLQVSLEQIRRARRLGLADDLRMERDMVHHCFHMRPGTASETVEGIRALAVDKDHTPRWNPAQHAQVTPAMVQAFFISPWATTEHPLCDLV